MKKTALLFCTIFTFSTNTMNNNKKIAKKFAEKINVQHKNNNYKYYKYKILFLPNPESILITLKQKEIIKIEYSAKTEPKVLVTIHKTWGSFDSLKNHPYLLNKKNEIEKIYKYEKNKWKSKIISKSILLPQNKNLEINSTLETIKTQFKKNHEKKIKEKKIINWEVKRYKGINTIQ
ncbi:hypothetical protein KAH94_00420 [bacterium]|nr:hypothetical protein [bacterium]